MNYTGQILIPELGMYYYKAPFLFALPPRLLERRYSPTLGRFMQTDPIGYGDGMNMYRYVGNDPVNGVDPSGLSCENGMHPDGKGGCVADHPIVVKAPRLVDTDSGGEPAGLPAWFSVSDSGGPPNNLGPTTFPDFCSGHYVCSPGSHSTPLPLPKKKKKSTKVDLTCINPAGGCQTYVNGKFILPSKKQFDCGLAVILLTSPAAAEEGALSSVYFGNAGRLLGTGGGIYGVSKACSPWH